jgi:aspartate/methionine/tyrosine aminotransferase
MTDAIATTILEDEKFHTQFLEDSKRALEQHRMIAARTLDDAGIPYVQNAWVHQYLLHIDVIQQLTLHTSRNAGFFLWIDLSACLHSPLWEAEDDLQQRLYDYGVEMSSGRAYHDETPGKFRFIFSVNKDTLVEGLSRCVLVLF